MRIVSLIASSTEIICALGMREYMVGRSHECDYPPDVKNLPVCTGPKFAVDGSSYEIDQRVRAIVQEGLSVYRVDADILEKLQPSHIITQSQCQVCAVSLRDVEAAACQMITSRPIIVSLQPDCLEDIWQDIFRVAMSLEIEHRGVLLIDELKHRVDEIRQRAIPLARRPRVACIEWIEPLMSAGNWMPELIQLAGGINLFGEAGKHSPMMSFAQIVEQDPEVIIVTPCGFDIDRTLQEMHLLKDKSEWSNLKSVQTNKIFVADGNQYFNRPGPRVVESLEIVAEILHPSLFQFGHENRGWVRYT